MNHTGIEDVHKQATSNTGVYTEEMFCQCLMSNNAETTDSPKEVASQQ